MAKKLVAGIAIGAACMTSDVDGTLSSVRSSASVGPPRPGFHICKEQKQLALRRS